MTPKIKFSTDDGLTWHNAKLGIRLILEGIEGSQELHINVTHEGVITDSWRGDEHTGTEGLTFEEIVDRLAT